MAGCASGSRTINVAALTTSNFTFSQVSISGTATAGGAQTFTGTTTDFYFGATNNKKDWYTETYVNLVTETFFGRNVFLSEKIFKPLSNLQPFIVLGDYGTIAELKRLGFKTFEPFIDESYDLEINPKTRIQKIETEIEKLKNKSNEKNMQNKI
mgnify:CR=1 FL=1